MFIAASLETGVAAKVTQDVISGQFVKVQHISQDDRTCSLVAASGDIATGVNWGIAYYDPYKAAWERPEGGASFAERVSFMTSTAPQATAKVVLGRFVTVCRGRLRGWTDQLDDGTYQPGMYLTVNPATARLKLAGASDPVHAQIEQMQRTVTVVNQNDGVEVLLTLPGSGVL